MRLTTSRLRSVIVNQASFVAAARASMTAAGFGNPQWNWLHAAIRTYFESSRDAEQMWAEFSRRIQQGQQSVRRQSLADGARRLLERFLAFDEDEVDIPADLFPPTRDVQLGNHSIAVRRDLIYVEGLAYRVRQLWTNHDLAPNHPRAGEMAAAVMLSVDSDLGPASTKALEVWGLRHGIRRSWTRAELGPEVTRLRDRLDAVEAAINQP